MLHTQLIFAHNLPPKQKILDETLTTTWKSVHYFIGLDWYLVHVSL